MIEVVPVVDPSMRGMCRKPYPGHPKGCPNWNARDTCPPKARPLRKVFDLSKPVYVVFNEFDLASHVERMRAKHPRWSWRQLVCCLYWQGSARKALRAKIADAKLKKPDLLVLTVPEAHGVNVTETMRAIGIDLEWPPMKKTYQVALLGSPPLPPLPPSKALHIS